MSENTSALRLGAPVRFQDRWAGKVTAVEISEDWEVYNVAVKHGFFRPVSVRLPLEAATGWDDDVLAFDETRSAAAFAREVPPVAAPSRPVSLETPASGGWTLAGVLISPSRRRVREVLVERGGRTYRVPVEGVTFEGKTMHPGGQAGAIVPYYTEDELRDRVKRALALATGISTSELQHIRVEGAGAGARLSGNVRSRNTREAVRVSSAALGIPVDTTGLVEDLELETRIAMALDRFGLGRTAQVSVRSVLGAVVLRGRAPSRAAADEAARVAAGVPGARAVVNRIEAGAVSPGSNPPAAIAG